MSSGSSPLGRRSNRRRSPVTSSRPHCGLSPSLAQSAAYCALDFVHLFFPPCVAPTHSDGRHTATADLFTQPRRRRQRPPAPRPLRPRYCRRCWCLHHRLADRRPLLPPRAVRLHGGIVHSAGSGPIRRHQLGADQSDGDGASPAVIRCASVLHTRSRAFSRSAICMRGLAVALSASRDWKGSVWVLVSQRNHGALLDPDNAPAVRSVGFGCGCHSGFEPMTELRVVI